MSKPQIHALIDAVVDWEIAWQRALASPPAAWAPTLRPAREAFRQQMRELGLADALDWRGLEELPGL